MAKLKYRIPSFQISFTDKVFERLILGPTALLRHKRPHIAGRVYMAPADVNRLGEVATTAQGSVWVAEHNGNRVVCENEFRAVREVIHQHKCHLGWY
jgi:hypothetical protein